ncbi:MAG: hypothetical protein K8S20_00550 [Chloroflexi bacterium]|nr:hypothetical protein [Chloroflexota bacterium]
MAKHFTVLINHGTNRVMVLDNFKVRYNRMRKRIADWVNILKPVPDIQFVMITLTYAPQFDWQPNHIREFMLAYRKQLGDSLLAYAWVAELQKRGAVHYHVMLVVPNYLTVENDLPYPDQSGLWTFGFTRVEIARTPFYLVTYLGKEYQKDFSNFPKGIRVFAVFIQDKLQKQSLRYQSLRLFQKELVDEFGWAELPSLTKLRKEIMDELNLGWSVWSFERDKEDAIQKAVSWEKFGKKWSGRAMFVGGQDGQS